MSTTTSEPVSTPAATVDPNPSAASPGAPPAVDSAQAAATDPALPPAETAVAAAPDPAPAEPSGPRSLLEGATTETPLDPAAKPTEAKTTEVKPPDAAAPVKYEPFTLPEGVKADEAKIAEFQTLIGTHGVTQETAQKLVNLHTANLQAYAEQVAQDQVKAWNETRAGWVQQIKSDEQLGGAGHQTVTQAVARMRDLFVPNGPEGSPAAAERKAFNEFLNVTGAGDHPAFWRFLYNVSRRFDEPAAPAIQARPPADLGRKPGSRPGVRLLYDNPTSNRGAG